MIVLREEALLERNQDKFVGQHLEKMSKKRAVQKEKSVDFYTDEFVFLQQKHRYNLRQTKKKQVFEVPNILQNIDIFYALNKLKYACYIVNRKNIYKNETALDDIDNLLKNIEKQHFYENKALEIYFFCFKMLETEDEVYFEKLKNLLEKKGSILTENELKNIYALALNFCNKKVRNGENYYHKMLAIYLMMLEKGFLQDGKYTYHKYIKNIVTTALKAEEFELAKEITIVYKTKVEPKFRKTLFCLNTCR